VSVRAAGLRRSAEMSEVAVGAEDAGILVIREEEVERI